MKTLTNLLIEAKTLDEIKKLINKYFIADNSIPFAHFLDNQSVDIAGNYPTRKTFNANLIALIAHKHITFFFGEISNQESCQNKLVIMLDKTGTLKSFLEINVGTPKKPKYLGFDCPAIGFLGYYLNEIKVID